MRYRVNMIFGENEIYAYGTYESRNKANEVAEYVRESRGCDVQIEEVE